ncbi:MAG: S1 RNA-binding domain-containing protein [Candidatus Saganbacteria bacterium]|nr:S1 RNA-binding domain-containing protein [Candidatus Saganbacteria bacterium]
MEDDQKNGSSFTPPGLEGTSIGSLSSREGLNELDALIAETLSESKTKERPASAQKESAFAATPFTIKPAAPKPELQPKEEQTVMKPSQEPAAAVKEIKAAPQAETTKDRYDKTFKTYNSGDIVKGTVVKIDPTGILVDINYKSDGLIPSHEIGDRALNVGDKIDVLIDAVSTKEGHVLLSLKKAEIEGKWRALYDSFRFKTALEVKVTSAVGGGLVVDFSGIRGFVPASQVFKGPDTPLSDFVGKIIPVKVLEIDRRCSKIIMSHRLGNQERQKVDREKLFDQIEIGQVLKGTVSNIKKFGAFVNINGIEGLVHINDLSWKRIDDPSKVLSPGQEIEVFVIGVDRQYKKLSLGLKQLQPDPWANAADKYRPGQLIEVKVLRFAKFGAFVEIEEGIEGLIHNTELTSKNVQNPQETVKTGDIVKAKVLRISPDEQKIGLSIREAEIDEEKAQVKQAQPAANGPKITIGDTVSEDIKEQLANQNNGLPEQA